MMRCSRLLPLIALSIAFTVAEPVLSVSPATVWAQDDEDEDEDEDDEFETFHIGGRLGIWYRPEISMDAKIGGDQGLANIIPDTFDIERDLGVSQNVISDYGNDFDENAIMELELFVETEWIGIYVLLVAPYEYQGKTTLTKTIEFGGQQFSASTDVESTFRQWYGGLDFEINILNNRYVRVSPLLGIRALGIDWEIEENSPLGLSADTKDIDTPLEMDDLQIFPYPELGIDVRVGYRDYIDVGLKVAGSFLSGYDVEGGTIRVELTATAYPLPWVGIQVGARYLSYDFESEGDDPADQYNIDLEFTGLMFGIIVRL
jgi:hypothetical protein